MNSYPQFNYTIPIFLNIYTLKIVRRQFKKIDEFAFAIFLLFACNMQVGLINGQDLHVEIVFFVIKIWLKTIII